MILVSPDGILAGGPSSISKKVWRLTADEVEELQELEELIVEIGSQLCDLEWMADHETG